MLTLRRVTVTGLATLVLAGCGGDGNADGDTVPTPTPTPEATSGGDDARAALEKLDGAQVATRVQALRKLQYRHGAPEVKIVSPQDTTDYLRAQVERSYPPERFASDEDFYQLTGIVPVDVGLRELIDTFGASLILGFYDPRNPDELNMVTNEQAAIPKAAEATLAHELTHGLQDQVFGLDMVQDIKDAERSLAASALLEGDAQVLELAYGKKYLDGGPESQPPPGGLPPAFLLYALFPYQFGGEFVGELIKKGGYDLVDQVWRERLPETTEQILHPEKYLSGEAARQVRLQPSKALDDWEATGSQTFGELDALALLSTKALPEGKEGKQIGAAAEGWDGGIREVYSLGEDRALAIATTWETPKDAAEFAASVERSFSQDREGTASGGAFEIPDVGFATLSADGRDVRIAIAPEADLAKQIVSGA